MAAPIAAARAALWSSGLPICTHLSRHDDCSRNPNGSDDAGVTERGGGGLLFDAGGPLCFTTHRTATCQSILRCWA